MLTQDPLPALWCALIAAAASVPANLAESAAVYLDDSTLENDAEDGSRRAAKLLRLLKNHRTLKLSVYIVSVICTVAAAVSLAGCTAALAEKRYSLTGGSVAAVYWISVIAVAVLYFALAVYSPRRIAAYFPQAAYPLCGWLSFCSVVTAPFAFVVNAISSIVVRVFGKDPDSTPSSVTEEEIRMLVDEGNERGTIEESEMKMINSIFEFDDRDVSQVMTHRTELAAVEINYSLEQVAQVATDSGYSRLPVYDGNIDSICGFLYAKDLISYITRPHEFHLADHVRKAIFVPETGSCSDTFSRMQAEKTQIAIVVDEYGGTYGVVTMEDLLESIVGSIQDEYDSEEAPITEIEEGVFLLDGSMSISDVERLLDFYVPDDSEADTLGGFIIELLGGVPQAPSDPRTAVFNNITFTVVHSDEKKIEKIRAVINSQPEE